MCAALAGLDDDVFLSYWKSFLLQENFQTCKNMSSLYVNYKYLVFECHYIYGPNFITKGTKQDESRWVIWDKFTTNGKGQGNNET